MRWILGHLVVPRVDGSAGFVAPGVTTIPRGPGAVTLSNPLILRFWFGVCG